MALKEKVPQEEGPRQPPHYLFVPNIKSSVSKSLVDPTGAFDPRTGERKTSQTVFYFFPGKATPIQRDDHAEKLLEVMANSNVVEVAHAELPDQVKEYHPEYEDRFRRGQHDTSRVVERVVKRYKPVYTKIVRTGKEVAAGQKKGLKASECRVDAVPEKLNSFPGEQTHADKKKTVYNQAELIDMKAPEQRAIIKSLDPDAKVPRKESERIDLILRLQEEV